MSSKIIEVVTYNKELLFERLIYTAFKSLSVINLWVIIQVLRATKLCYPCGGWLRHQALGLVGLKVSQPAPVSPIVNYCCYYSCITVMYYYHSF